MRKLMLAALLVLALPSTARADFGLGLFLGDPTGVDLKIDIERRSALDIVLGWDTFRDGRGGYGHLTYLVTPVVGRGRAVLVPLRLGIGVAVYGFRNDVNVGIRAPLELALRFRSAPLEIYGEVALMLQVVSPVDFDVQGGIGFRIFF